MHDLKDILHGTVFIFFLILADCLVTRQIMAAYGESWLTMYVPFCGISCGGLAIYEWIRTGRKGRNGSGDEDSGNRKENIRNL